jgi:hypothetical protein
MTDHERTEERRALEGQMREYLESCDLHLEVLLAPRPCSRCGSHDPADGRGFFTAKTYHPMKFLGAWGRCFGRPAVEWSIERIGSLVICRTCWEKLQANGSWAAILEERKLAKKEKIHGNE